MSKLKRHIIAILSEIAILATLFLLPLVVIVPTYFMLMPVTFLEKFAFIIIALIEYVIVFGIEIFVLKEVLE